MPTTPRVHDLWPSDTEPVGDLVCADQLGVELRQVLFQPAHP